MSTFSRAVCRHKSSSCYRCAKEALAHAPPEIAESFARIVEDSNIGIEKGVYYASDIDRLIAWVKNEPTRHKTHAEEAPLPGEPVRLPSPTPPAECCPYPGCPGVKGHVECPECGEEHCSHLFG